MARKVNTEDAPALSKQDELANVLAESLNKKFKKDGKVAYFLDGSESTPTDLTEWISTGSSLLDLAISNRPNGGIPVGRITELTGLEASGKSLLAAHLLANTQEKGGLAVYIDTENAMNEDFLRAIGIDLNKMLYIQLEAIEDIFDVIENIITKVKESDKNKLVTIVVDSVAAATTKVEQAADYEKDGWATSKAIILSKAMRKITQMIGRERVALIFTNQLRVKLGVSFGDIYTTSGGKAIGFHASCRLRLKAVGQIKAKINGFEQVIGIKTRAKIVKNRMGPPLREAEFHILFESGIDDYGSWLQVMKDYGLITIGGAWYTFTDEATGEQIKFLSKDFVSKILNDPARKQTIYDKICKELVMNYKAENLGIDDVQVGEGDVPIG
jgi:recombination protein RecA|tara:strand:+ start:1467 stop:2621 length:1155 start_codon:yes stop_codon:yes gene_type:complete